jgi:PAS domain S-box-containing protein
MTAVLPDLSASPTRDEPRLDALDELDAVGLREVLDQDSRPTFVLDLDSDYVEYGGRKDDLRPVFCNTALSLHHQLLDSVTTGTEEDVLARDADGPSYDSFRSWASGFSKVDDSRDIFPLTFFFRDLLWTGSTVRQRWRIISGNQCYQTSQLPKGDLRAQSPDHQAPEQVDLIAIKDSPEPRDLDSPIQQPSASKRPRIAAAVATIPSQEASEPTLVASTRGRAPGSAKVSDGKSNNTTSSGSSITLASPEQDCPDWTAKEPTGVLSDHAQFARSVDWAATPLGPISSWSREFREITNLVMRNPHPCSLFWGEELTMFYNEAYKNEVAGNKHPELMGTGFSGPFSELWDGVAPIFRECARTGKSIRKENDPLPINRYGYLEETFFSWSFIPLYGGTSKILGFYNGPFETTYQTISSRRMQTLRQLGERLSQARSIKHFWKCVVAALEDNHYDVPFALLYSITDAEDADSASHSSDSTISLKCCLLEGSIGIPDDHAASPPKLDLKRSKEGFIPAFREAMRTREPTTLHTRDGTLPEVLLEDIEWKRGYGDPCKEAIIIPVRPTNNENILAFLVIGINPRRAYDEDYKTFAAMLNRQLATSLASFLLFEDEVRRSRSEAEAAALQRERLSQQLELQTSRMRRMTELSPLGMYLFSPEGVLLEANERYYEMTGHPRDETGQLSFLDLMESEYVQEAEDMWNSMVQDLQPSAKELKLKVPKVQPRDLNNEPIEYWVLASSLPEIGPDGKIRSIMGSIADISHMKWAQGLQDQRLREAEETKRQQNEFIDITSHEASFPGRQGIFMNLTNYFLYPIDAESA